MKQLLRSNKNVKLPWSAPKLKRLQKKRQQKKLPPKKRQPS